MPCRSVARAEARRRGAHHAVSPPVFDRNDAVAALWCVAREIDAANCLRSLGEPRDQDLHRSGGAGADTGLRVGTVSAGGEILSAISGQEVRWTLGIVFADFGEEAGDQVRFAARNRRSFLPSPLSSASIQVSSPTEATKWTKSQRSSSPQRKKASRQVGPFVPSLRCPRS